MSHRALRILPPDANVMSDKSMDDPQDMIQFHSLRTRIKALLAWAAVCLSLAGTASAAEIPSGKSGFEAHIKPFFKTYCVKCHGPEKAKGKVTLHGLDGDLAEERNLKRWDFDHIVKS